MAAPFILASPDPLNGHVFVETNWADTPSVLYVNIQRVDTLTGVATPVRNNGAVSPVSGDYIRLSGGVAIVYDTEAPFDRAIHYTVGGLGSALTASTADLILADGTFWLKDPVYPGHNLAITTQGAQNPQCVPGRDIHFVRMDAEGYLGRGEAAVINDRKLPVPTIRLRSGKGSTLVLATRTFTDRDATLDILAPGTPLMFQAPVEYGIPDHYLHVPAEATVARLGTDHRKQWRSVTIPHVEVDRPAGLSYGVAGARWMDVCLPYATFAAVTAAGVRWELAMQGGAAPVGSGPLAGWRTYDSATAEFATYTASEVVPRTYTDMLEGR